VLAWLRGDDLLQRVEPAAPSPAPTRDPLTEAVAEAVRLGRFSGEADVLGTSAVWSCVRVIADAIAAAPWGEWRGAERLPDSRLTRSPAAWHPDGTPMTRHDWAWQVVATLALYNVCALRLTDAADAEGVPLSVIPLRPGSWTRSGRIWYVDGEETPASRIRLIRRAVLPSTDAEVATLLRLARAELDAMLYAGEYVADYWAQGRAPVTVIRTEQDLTDEQASTIRARWITERAKGPSNPAVLGRGADAKPFGADAAGKDATEAQRELVANVARWFGVPPHLVNAPTAAGGLTYTNTETAGRAFVNYTLTAYTVPIADAISGLLPGDYLTGRRIVIDLSHLTRPDTEAQARAWAAALGAGGGPAWMTVDEVREAAGLPTLGGDASRLLSVSRAPSGDPAASQEGAT
jgi:phage portal protein BeeE